MVNVTAGELWCPNNAIDNCAGAFYYLPMEAEEFSPARLIPNYALVVLSLKRNIGSFVFVSKHEYVNGEWVVPITIDGKYFEFVPKYISDVYTVDRTLQVRPSQVKDTVLLGKDISTEETIALINNFDSVLCEIHIEELKQNQ